MKDVEVVSKIGIQDIPSNIVIDYGAGARLADVAQSIRSNNYNFEEEQLLGCDRIITRQYDNNCYREKIEFRTKNVSNKYYYLDYYEYDTRPDAPDFDAIVNGNKLCINLYNKNNDTFPQVASSRRTTQVYKLYWKNAQNSDELISTREIIKDILFEDGINKQMIIEKITHPSNE